MAKKKAVSATGPSRRWIILAVVAVVLLAGGGLYLFRASPSVKSRQTAQPPAEAQSSVKTKVILPATPRQPRPPTLPPEQFKDPMTRKSYEIARDNPALLEQMPCYCGCYLTPGHTSNLDCFVDRHGET